MAEDATPSPPLLLHVACSAVGRLKRRYEPGEFVPDGATEPLSEAVVEFDNGHRFIDRKGSLRPLSPIEERVYLSLEDTLRTVVTGAAVALASAGVPPGSALQLVNVALTAQLRALGVGVGGETTIG